IRQGSKPNCQMAKAREVAGLRDHRSSVVTRRASGPGGDPPTGRAGRNCDANDGHRVRADGRNRADVARNVLRAHALSSPTERRPEPRPGHRGLSGTPPGPRRARGEGALSVVILLTKRMVNKTTTARFRRRRDAEATRQALLVAGTQL